MRDEVSIKPNKDNDRKFMTGGMTPKDPEKKKKDNEDTTISESAGQAGPVEYFTE